MVSIQRHLALLRGQLRPGEAERRWIRAERIPQGHAGALVLTDQRLLFSGFGFVSQSQEAWPLAVIGDVRADDGALAFRVIGEPERFTGKAAELALLAADLPADRGEAASASIADGLERLVRLRESGALTPAEFAVAKRRLLE